MRYTREDLIRTDQDTGFLECVLCGRYGRMTVFHKEDCPFADPEVDRVWVTGRKRMADHNICGRCDVDIEHCPVNGWACTTHEQALKLCERYREHYVT